MKKIILFILLLATVLTVTACGNDEELPEGMQLACGGEAVGYYFYVPEEWVVGNTGRISAAYASSIDKSSATFVTEDMPGVPLGEYFAASMASFPYEYTLNIDNQSVTFGNAESATSFVYDYDVGETKYRTLQILSVYGDRLGIFTFTSYRTNRSSEEMTQYDYFREKRQAIIDNFKYCALGESAGTADRETDADGYMLVSDKTVAKFSLWVPESFDIVQSSGIVECRMEDGSTVSVTTAHETGVVVSEYWKNRKAQLEELFGTVTEIEIDTACTLGDSRGAFSYEYTYVYKGTTYHVYQILAIADTGILTTDGFVFTYTATEENFSANLDVIKKICDKVTY